MLNCPRILKLRKKKYCARPSISVRSISPNVGLRDPFRISLASINLYCAFAYMLVYFVVVGRPTPDGSGIAKVFVLKVTPKRVWSGMTNVVVLLNETVVLFASRFRRV